MIKLACKSTLPEVNVQLTFSISDHVKFDKKSALWSESLLGIILSKLSATPPYYIYALLTKSCGPWPEYTLPHLLEGNTPEDPKSKHFF